jgi:biopolymer transport protein TolR
MGIPVGDGKQSTMLNEINVTPFVDVALVLLVIFMVTAPMIGRGVEVDLPRTRAAIMEVDQSKLLLVINEHREVLLDNQKIPHDRLEIALRTNERLQREHEVYLQADRNIPYGFVVHVMSILREAGVTELGLVTDPVSQDGESDVAGSSAEASERAPATPPAESPAQPPNEAASEAASESTTSSEGDGPS